MNRKIRNLNRYKSYTEPSDYTVSTRNQLPAPGSSRDAFYGQDISDLQQCLHELRTNPLLGEQSETEEASEEPPQQPPRSNTIVIHVCDEARKLSKDFSCDRDVLLSGMTYFRDFLDDSEEEVDISVHCDLKIFEWLIDYISSSTQKPELGRKELISILISSQFLGMDALVRECIQFFKVHANDIISLPIDLSCINEPLIDQISELYTPEDIDHLIDPKRKIKNRLFRRTLDMLLKEFGGLIRQCSRCGDLFSESHWNDLKCNAGTFFVDFHGKASSRHLCSRNWELSKYILGLRMRGFQWSDIYWQIWALTQPLLECILCKMKFPINQFNHCHYHKKSASFAPESNTGIYRCCNAKADRFHILPEKRSLSCKHMCHTLHDEQSEKLLRLIETAQQYRDLIFIPYQQFKPKDNRPFSATSVSKSDSRAVCSRAHYSLGLVSDKGVPKEYSEQTFAELSVKYEFSKPRLGTSKESGIQWIAGEKSHGDLSDSEELDDVSDEDEDDLDICDISETKRKQKTIKQIKDTFRKMGAKPRMPRRYLGRRNARRTKSKKRLEHSYLSSPTKKRQWKLDNLRVNDTKAIDSLMKSLGDVHGKSTMRTQKN